jgi:hypothetical protein
MTNKGMTNKGMTDKKKNDKKRQMRNTEILSFRMTTDVGSASGSEEF